MFILSIVVSAVFFQLFGAFWFMAVIPRVYARALNRTDLAGRKPEPLFIAGPAVCMTVVTITNAYLLGALHITALPDALLFGAVTGIGYLAATVFNVGINPNIPRPLLYGAINAPYFVLGNVVTCGIITALATR